VNRFRFIAKSLIHGAIDWSGRSYLQRRNLRGKLIILTYHSFCTKWPRGLFNSIPINRFEKQVRFLKGNFQLVSLQQGIDNLRQGRRADKPYLAITIDDGFQDNYTLAWPVLQRYGVPATIFLATDFIDTGRSPWPTQLIEILERTKVQIMETPYRAELGTLDQRAVVARDLKKSWGSLPPMERFERLKQFRQHLRVNEDTHYPPLTWNQIHEMKAQGVQFGSHTVYHSILPKVKESVILKESNGSKQRIENVLHAPCQLFAYPDGKHNLPSKKILLSAGYLAAVTQDKGFNLDADNFLELKRIEVPFHDPMSSYRVRVSLA